MSADNAPAAAAIPVDAPPAENAETQSLQQFFSDLQTNIGEWRSWSSEQCKALEGWDHRVAKNVTDFKRDYILSIGGLMNRSICMAVSSGLTYKLVSNNTASLLARTRNLGVSFLLNGWLFVPELFNPFLKNRD